MSPLETARETDLGEYGGLPDPERIVGKPAPGPRRAGRPASGEPIDVITAMLEVIDFNGGRPLTCTA
jgi:cyclase